LQTHCEKESDMSREKDQLRNTQDAGYMTQSGNHAAGGPLNDTTQVNKAPNIEANRQSSAAGSEGGDMTDQSIGGSGTQDGIRGTPSGTQGGQSGQGINQGGQSQQSAQGQSDYMGGSPGGAGNQQGQQAGSQQSQRQWQDEKRGDPQYDNRDASGEQQTGATSGEVGESGLRGNQQSDTHGAGSGRTAGAGARQSHGDDGSAPGAGTAQRGSGGSQQLGGQQSSSPGGSGDMATNLQGGPGGSQQSGGAKGGPGQSGLAQMKEEQKQGGPGNEQSHAHAGTGHGHGGQHSGGMGGERGGALHNVGAQSGQTGRGGLGGNNVEMQGSSKGNQQSGPNLIGQQTQGSGGSTSADRDSLDSLPMDAMGGERVGMGSHGNSQQSDKAGNAQADTWSNQARPNNRTDNEQADRQLGMQGSPGEPGHDIDDLGSKQSGGGGSRGGGSEDQR
jgi:hypothetical protein